jgi:hypothetical protein
MITAALFGANTTEIFEMIQLTPSQIYLLSDAAYKAKGRDLVALKDQLGLVLPFVDLNSLKPITATSGLFTPWPVASVSWPNSMVAVRKKL